MPLRPHQIFATLAEHKVRYVVIGGLAAVLHGSSMMTNDVDICPDPANENLERLCAALRDMNTRIRTATEDDGVAFACEPGLLSRMQTLDLVTDFGNFDLWFSPAGFARYTEFIGHAQVLSIDGVAVPIAALDDVIRSKEAANREKDRAALPLLYALRDEIAAREARDH